MLKFGGWRSKVSIENPFMYPEKVALSVDEFTKKPRFGCTFYPIIYLADQQVDGTNHAVLAQQTVLNGRDSNNAVILVFNEKFDSSDVSLVSINRIVESGGPVGGTQVSISLNIPDDAKSVFDDAYFEWTGSKITPFAFIGQQVVRGINYIFAAKLQQVTREKSPVELTIVVVNSLDRIIKPYRMFNIGINDDLEYINKLGYAFTW